MQHTTCTMPARLNDVSRSGGEHELELIAKDRAS